MTADNYGRMIRLAEEFFDMKNDPDQISVNEEVRKRLLAIHPATMSEERDANGPVAWMLLIPTTKDVMDRFVAGWINEKQLLEQTAPGQSYDAIYLCSALVLPEYRREGIAHRLAINAIDTIRRDHPIRSLYTWSFSEEGDTLAVTLAEEMKIPLLRR
jgi:GNAT superfamily N-acetyltransferase